MKKLIFCIVTLLFCANLNAQINYNEELNKFIGAWIQPKEMDYDGIYHVLIKKVENEIIVRAKICYPSDLPSTTTNIPISDVSYSGGKIVTNGIISEMPIKPNHMLIISVQNNEMHLIHKIKNTKQSTFELISDIRLIEQY